MTYPYSFTVKLYEFDHFEKYWEDRKNNMFIPNILPEIGAWIRKNTSGDYDLNCEDMYIDEAEYIIIGFNSEVEACMFCMAWCKDPLSFYRPKMHDVEIMSLAPFTSEWNIGESIIEWLNEYIGKEGFAWNRTYKTVCFYKKEDAVLFKMRWG